MYLWVCFQALPTVLSLTVQYPVLSIRKIMNYPVCVLDTWMIQHGFHLEMQLTVERLEAGGRREHPNILPFFCNSCRGNSPENVTLKHLVYYEIHKSFLYILYKT